MDRLTFENIIMIFRTILDYFTEFYFSVKRFVPYRTITVIPFTIINRTFMNDTSMTGVVMILSGISMSF